MTRGELEHAIRAACDVAADAELWVFGSQAVLGEFPDPPEFLRQSIEVDVAPRNRPERADAIDAGRLADRIALLPVEEEVRERLAERTRTTANR